MTWWHHDCSGSVKSEKRINNVVGFRSVHILRIDRVCDLYRLKTQIWGRRLREIRSDENIVPAGWRCGCNWSGGAPVSVWQMFHGDQACFKQPNTLCLHGNEIRTSKRCWPAPSHHTHQPHLHHQHRLHHGVLWFLRFNVALIKDIDRLISFINHMMPVKT